MKIVTAPEFKQILGNSKGVVVLDVYADWCGPCKMLAPVIGELSEKHKEITFVKMNSEDPKNISFIRDKKVTSIPEIFYYKDGVEKHRQIGFVPGEMIIEKCESL